MSGVQPCRFSLGVLQLRTGVAQMLLMSAMHLCAHGHALSSAPVLFINCVAPFFKGFTPCASTGFWLGWCDSDQVSFTIMRLLRSMILAVFSSCAKSLCNPCGTPSCLMKSWWDFITFSPDLDSIGQTLIILDMNPLKTCSQLDPS